MASELDIDIPFRFAMLGLQGFSKVKNIERPFYIEDSLVVVQVEEQKYKIHRYFLTRESVFFNDLLSLPQSGDPTSVEGSSDDNPIKLPETPTVEFENLLRFFYFGMHDDYTATLADWIAMLSISTRLIFEKVRSRAIKEITPRLDEIEPFELIGLAVKYDVEQWLKPAYRRIVTRSSLITHPEALKVAFPVAVMLMRSRELYWKTHKNNSHHHREASTNGVNWAPVDSILDLEIRSMVLDSNKSQTWGNTHRPVKESRARVPLE